MIYDKGYQDTETVISTCLTKVKGFLVGDVKTGSVIPSQIWDNTEIVYPPMESGAVLIITNTIETPHQTPCASQPVSHFKNNIILGIKWD